MNPSKLIQFFAVSLLCLGASLQAHAVELSIRNSSQDDESSGILEIVNAISKEAPKTKINLKVYPSETKRITLGNVTSFTVNRIFPSHKLRYVVSCPADVKGEVEITPVQIHEEKLPLGCQVEKRGHWSKRTGLNWEKRNDSEDSEESSRAKLREPISP